MSVASKDGVIDAHERALLRELNDMIANRSLTLKRDP
jgi:tellurite resistance protein